jgi:hypothetical protein
MIWNLELAEPRKREHATVWNLEPAKSRTSEYGRFGNPSGVWFEGHEQGIHEQVRNKVKVVVSKSPGLGCELVAGL